MTLTTLVLMSRSRRLQYVSSSNWKKTLIACSVPKFKLIFNYNYCWAAQYIDLFALGKRPLAEAFGSLQKLHIYI